MLKRTLFLILLVAAVALAACGSAQPASTSSAGNAEKGQALFKQTAISSAGLPGCATCHSLTKGQTLVGPSMAGVASEAAKDVQSAAYKGTAKTAAEFLRESIVNPDAWVTEGFQAGVMPRGYDKLSAQELDDLVAFLLTLK